MRLTTVRVDGGTSAGRVDGEQITVLPFDDVGALLASSPDWRAAAAVRTGRSVATHEADFAPLVPSPEKIFCVGINYRDHCAEVGLEMPDHPTLFAKYGRSLIGANDDLELPGNSDAVDWEVELGVVIGSAARHVDEAQAREAIAGYTIINDVSMRDWQLRTSQYLQGKTFERSTPIGPFLVTPDEVDDAAALSIGCTVDDEKVQASVTSELVFSPAQIVAYISEFITLAPGDVIATGTPSGIGGARKPPKYLAPGCTLRSQIDGLGEQANRCVAPAGVR